MRLVTSVFANHGVRRVFVLQEVRGPLAAGLFGLLSLFIGCDPAEKQAWNSVCVAGALSCPCLPDGNCQTRGGQRLECDRGYCVPAGDCPDGAENCRCHGNLSCDPKAGVPMTCDGNVCTETLIPAGGELNGECANAGACGTHDGTALSCLGGVCQLEKCRSGNYLCPCSLYGRCDDFEGEAVLCNQGVCVEPGCEPGAAGCACTGTSGCAAGTLCSQGVCRSMAMRLGLEARGARGCDVLLQLSEPVPVTVEFAAGVRGQFLQRSAAVSLALVATADEDLSEGVALLSEASRSELLSASPAALAVKCFNRLGVELTEAKVDVR